MISRNTYHGSIPMAKLAGAHIIQDDVHTFYAIHDTAMEIANEIDTALEDQGIDIYADDFVPTYTLDNCPPSCQYR
jgi:hypothetical protein